MVWKNGWPVIGVDADGDGIGEPVSTQKKPKSATVSAITAPVDSDTFDGKLSLAWQWNSNSQADWADLKAAPSGTPSNSSTRIGWADVDEFVVAP